jgi:hypothetical protein
VVSQPADIPVGHVAVVEDAFGNRRVVLDLLTVTYETDDAEGSGSL